MSIAYLLLGSNLGNRRVHLCNAEEAIKRAAGKILRSSDVFESPAWGFDDPRAFLNQALKLETPMEAYPLLKTILDIESKLGRERSTNTYKARNIDIDILFYDDIIINQQDLIIPHPRLHLRRFVLEPLSSIAGDYIHPSLKKSVNELLECCPDDSEVKLYNELDPCANVEGGGHAL